MDRVTDRLIDELIDQWINSKQIGVEMFMDYHARKSSPET